MGKEVHIEEEAAPARFMRRFIEPSTHPGFEQDSIDTFPGSGKAMRP
jgi:hypothetical protein